MTNLLESLVNDYIVGVTFIHDYFQLQFQSGAGMSIFTTASIVDGDDSTKYSEGGFADILVRQIGKQISSVTVYQDKCLIINLVGNTTISISLLEEDYVCPEAVDFRSNDGTLLVM